MDAYMYRAAFYCDECIDKVKEFLNAQGKRPANPSDEYTFDSDDYPKGPFENGGGEADMPQHCESCSVHLENPLTSDGEKYVRDAVSANGKPLIEEWAAYYSYLFNA